MRIIIISLLGVFFCGCDSAPLPSGPENVSVHLQSEFTKDQVRILINDRLVFSDRVTTDNRLGLAQIVELYLPSGINQIRIIVNGVARSSTEFDSRNIKVIAVQYYRVDDDVDIKLFSSELLYF